MLMALGMFVFELPALVYQELERRTDWRHGQTSRVGARAANQFLGPGEDVVTLTGSIPLELGDLAALETLREMGDAGDAYPLVDGRGKVHGLHVICDLAERQSHVLADGTPRITDFTLTLRHVDDDQAQAGQLRQPGGADLDAALADLFGQ